MRVLVACVIVRRRLVQDAHVLNAFAVFTTTQALSFNFNVTDLCVPFLKLDSATRFTVLWLSKKLSLTQFLFEQSGSR